MTAITINKFHKTTTNSGNMVVFADTLISRLFVISQDEKIILRGYLGDAACTYWQKVSKGKTVSVCDWKQELSKVEGAFPQLLESFGSQIPKREHWFTLITDEDIESSDGGNACADRYTFYRVTALANPQRDRDRRTWLEGEFEIILLYFHILQSGKLANVMHIWEHGKDGSLAPKSYAANLLKSRRFTNAVARMSEHQTA